MSTDLERAVLKALYPLPSVNPCMVTEADQPRLDRAVAKCAELREWAETSTELDAPTRAAYLKWVAHAEWTNDRCQTEITYGYRRKQHEEYCKRVDAEQKRANAITVVKPFGR
jgi:hypothetical protein